jgi:hypothetical protein
MPVMSPTRPPKRCGTSWNTLPLPMPIIAMAPASRPSAAMAGGSMAAPEITVSVEDEVVRRARCQAEAPGTSLDRLVREYLEQWARETDPTTNAAEFTRLSRLSHGDSRGWKFDREEIHER